MRSKPKKKKKTNDAGVVLRSRVSYWARTDVGLRREANEDYFLVDDGLQLFIVADGMGGHAGGGTASRMATEIIRERVAQAWHEKQIPVRLKSRTESQEVMKILEEAVQAASTAIHQLANLETALSGIGTTITLLLIFGSRGYVAHVGDSRLYRLRGNHFAQITEDHSLVQEQVRAGFITAEEAARSRFKNIITRSVGFESHTVADIFSIPIQPGDLFLLCTDGLSGMATDYELQLLLRSDALGEAPIRLIELANQHGGEDNITLVIVRCVQPGGTVVRKRARRSLKKMIDRSVTGLPQSPAFVENPEGSPGLEVIQVVPLPDSSSVSGS